MSETIEASKEIKLVDYVHAGQTYKVYPEVAEFFRVRREAERHLAITRLKAQRTYTALRDAEQLAYLEGDNDLRGWSEGVSPTLRTADRVRRDAIIRAEGVCYDLIDPSRIAPHRRTDPHNPNSWATLRDATSDKQIKWMMEHSIQNNSSETLTMLRYLPNTPEELWRIGKEDHDFCAVFDQYYAQMEAAGLFSEHDLAGMVGLKEFRALQSYMRRELYGNTATEVGRKVSRLMTIMGEDFDRRLQEAKAEWQGLDEAWRSERSRRGAATRAANREAQAQEFQREDGLTEEAPDGEINVSSPEYVAVVNATHLNVVMVDDTVAEPQEKVNA